MKEDMSYYTERLQCSGAEKDACLETVAKLYLLRLQIRSDGFLAGEILAETEPDPFFRACLMDLTDFWGDPDGLERLFTRYLMAGNYRGGAFLNAVLIVQGLVLLNRYESTDEIPGDKDWGKLLGEALRGYFGAEYREKVLETIRQTARAGQPEQEYLSPLPEFDGLVELSPRQRDWLVRHVSAQHLRYALKLSGSAVREFLMEGLEDRERFEQDLKFTCNVRRIDVLAAQRAILSKAEEARTI